MKLSVIQSLYTVNPWIPESVYLTMDALTSTVKDFELILFNDHGDEKVKDLISKFLLDKRVRYVYSEKNYGQKVCMGGWVGALPYVSGDLIHAVGHDDIFTRAFYKKMVAELENDPELMLVFNNCFVTSESLVTSGAMIHIRPMPEYYTHPFECFKWWFGVGENGKDEVTRANNNIPGPGTIYRAILHKQIGEPDLDNYFGSADFEFWARVLFNKCKCKYLPDPMWLYRKSEHSISKENDVSRTLAWNEKIKAKYYKLYNERKK